MDELMYLAFLHNLENLQDQQLYNNVRNARNAFGLNARQFINMFRVSKELCRHLIDSLEPLMRPKTRATDLNVESRVLIALRFFASGSYQLDIGSNKYLDVCQSTVSRCLKEVTEALTHPTIFKKWVKFPSNLEELNSVRKTFYEKHRFPGVIGCIDCTHVAIFPPKIDDNEHPEHLYVNRKNYHSINVQLICDANLKILNVNAKYPGSTNDAFIWNRSNVQTLMRDLHQRGNKDYFLLGDSGYPLRSWLLTPLEEEPVANSPEYNYNKAHKNTRAKIECCNGLLKGRFRCLLKHRVLHYKPEVACKIINACVVLHNMCIQYNVPEPDNDNEDIDIDFGIYENEPLEENNEERAFRTVNPELADGRRTRMNVIQRFRRL